MQVVALEVQQQTPCVLVWDLDASLSFPCSLQRYVEHVLKADQFVLAPNYERYVTTPLSPGFQVCDTFTTTPDRLLAANRDTFTQVAIFSVNVEWWCAL